MNDVVVNRIFMSCRWTADVLMDVSCIYTFKQTVLQFEFDLFLKFCEPA